MFHAGRAMIPSVSDPAPGAPAKLGMGDMVTASDGAPQSLGADATAGVQEELVVSGHDGRAMQSSGEKPPA